MALGEIRMCLASVFGQHVALWSFEKALFKILEQQKHYGLECSHLVPDRAG